MTTPLKDIPAAYDHIIQRLVDADDIEAADAVRDAKDFEGDARTMRGFIREHSMTPSMAFSLMMHWKCRALAAENTERQRSQWQTIDTAPQTGEFLAYGSYRYPDDEEPTEYIHIVEPTGDPEWPFVSHDGRARKGVFSHWMPIPSGPKGGDKPEDEKAREHVEKDGSRPAQEKRFLA